MKKQLIIFICISAFCNSNEVCDLSWPKCGLTIENIVCTRGEFCQPEPGCQEIPPDPEFLKFIVSEHNRLRNDIASGNETRNFVGPASNMMSISYDKDLEYSARCNVNTCKFQHDQCRGTKKFRYAGQNMYYTTESHDALKNAVVAWYNEINMNTQDVIDKFPKGRHDIGHFSQVIWAKTIKIGCSTAKSSSEDDGEKYYLTCNYGPSGNMIGKTVYERGEGCSNCPADVKCNENYPALCGEVDDSEVYGERSIYSSGNITIPTITTGKPADGGNGETANTNAATDTETSGGINETGLKGVPGMYRNGVAGIPLESFLGMFINGGTVSGLKGYGITGLYGIKNLFGGEIFTGGLGLIDGNVIPGTLIKGIFVPGTYFNKIFFPGIVIDGSFLPGVFIDKTFLPGTFFDGIFIPGAFSNGTFVPGTLINYKFSPGIFDESNAYNDGLTFKGNWVPGFSGLYGKGNPSSGNIDKSSVTFVLGVCMCLLCFWKKF